MIFVTPDQLGLQKSYVYLLGRFFFVLDAIFDKNLIVVLFLQDVEIDLEIDLRFIKSYLTLKVQQYWLHFLNSPAIFNLIFHQSVSQLAKTASIPTQNAEVSCATICQHFSALMTSLLPKRLDRLGLTQVFPSQRFWIIVLLEFKRLFSRRFLFCLFLLSFSNYFARSVYWSC